MRLAIDLRTPVNQLIKTMTSKQLTEWMAAYHIWNSPPDLTKAEVAPLSLEDEKRLFDEELNG